MRCIPERVGSPRPFEMRAGSHFDFGQRKQTKSHQSKGGKPMSNQKLKELLRYLSQPENLTNLAAFVIAVVLGYRGIQSGATHEYLQAMLAVLGILALAQLVAGYSAVQRDARIQRLMELTEGLENQLVSQLGADRFFVRRGALPPIESAFVNAKQIDVSAISLATLSVTHHALLDSSREAGCKIRLICTNPANRQIANLIAERIPEAPNGDMHIAHVGTALKALRSITGQSASGGNLEVRVINSLPPFGLFVVDGDSSHGKLRVELYPYGCPVADRPVIELLASRDGDWYVLFRQQFEALWQKAESVES
jgi:hypothetical protein